MNKMNKIKIFIILILSILVFQNCSDEFLVEMRDFKKSGYEIFENEQQTNDFLAWIYYNFYNGYNSPIETLYGSLSDNKTRMTEEIGGDVDDYINPTVTLSSAEDGDGYYGKKLTKGSPENVPYSRIRDCNTIIEEMDNFGTGHLSEEFINGAKGQAYFLRGLQYFDLMRTYGGVPLVTEVQTASAYDESIKLPRASIEEMIAHITDDFDEAARLLPSSWNPAANFGRPTQGAALAMKSRVLLTGASPLFNKDWDNPSNKRWADALDAAKAAIDELGTAGYELYGSSANDWAKMFYDFNNSMCPEAIFTILCSNASGVILSNDWEGDIRLPSQGGNGIPAPKQMIDLFPMADGSRPTAANGYDEFLFFKDRDPRFYNTFAFSGRKWRHSQSTDDPTTSVVWSYRWLDESGSANFSFDNELESYAFVCKMSNTTVDSTVYGLSGTDIYEYRFAELLLNQAECLAAQGKINECVEILGKIRNRVGIPSANNYGIGSLSDKYEALEACLYERRVELAYEGKRFWDLQRWMLYNDSPEADNNTCAKLGLAPLNGTARIGMYLQVKDSAVADNPLSSVLNLSFDPAAPNSSEQIDALANFYTQYFEFVDLVEPMDQVLGDSTVIDWKQNYYIHGLKTDILTANPWLQQTEGWTDNFGNPGTFKYR